MKVLDVTEFYSQRGGGVRSHLSVKTQVLCQLGHEHRVVVPGPQDATHSMWDTTLEDPAHPKDFGKNFQWLRSFRGPALPYDPSYHLLYRPDKVRAYIESERPDVLEIHSPYVAAVAAMMSPRSSFGVRTFVWHSDFVDTYRHVALRAAPRLGPWLGPLSTGLWAWARRIARACDRTFVASEFLKTKLDQQGLPRVVYLPFGVNKTVFHPAASDRIAFRQELGVTADSELLVAIGRFAIEKQTDWVLTAFAHLGNESPKRHLLLFGDGPERARLIALAAKITAQSPALAARIHFMGFEQDRRRLARALASSDILLHACPHETFGLGVAEALSCGLLAVLPDCGGTATWRTLASVASYTPTDAHALVDAARPVLRASLSERRERGNLGANSIKSEVEHFNALVAQYQELKDAQDSARARGRPQ